MDFQWGWLGDSCGVAYVEIIKKIGFVCEADMGFRFSISLYMLIVFVGVPSFM